MRSLYDTVSRARTLRMWQVLAALFSIGVVCADDSATVSPSSHTTFYTTSFTTASEPIEMLYFGLPSMTLTLDVETEDNDFIPFQDALNENLEHHLETFFRTKLLNTDTGNATFIEVDLDSRLVWNELSKVHQRYSDDETTSLQEFPLLKKYEVKGVFNCKVKLQAEPIADEDGYYDRPVRIHASLMDLFFLEAFQGDYHWDLLHGFLASTLLQDIINADIQVMDSGFIHPYDEYGNLMLEQRDKEYWGKAMNVGNSSERKSRLLVAGIVVGVIFLFAFVAIWITLWIATNGSNSTRFRWILDLKNRLFEDSDDESLKGTSRSVDSGECVDLDPSDDEDDDDDDESYVSRHLDAWAKNVTSIPLSNPTKKKKKKRASKVVKRPYFRPSNEHSSSLGCITEADNESQCSSVRSTSTWRRTRFFQRKPQHQETASKNSEDHSYVRSSSVNSALTSIIYEEDCEAEEEKTPQGSQSSIPRKLIKLIPSEDEEDR